MPAGAGAGLQRLVRGAEQLRPGAAALQPQHNNTHAIIQAALNIQWKLYHNSNDNTCRWIPEADTGYFVRNWAELRLGENGNNVK